MASQHRFPDALLYSVSKPHLNNLNCILQDQISENNRIGYVFKTDNESTAKLAVQATKYIDCHVNVCIMFNRKIRLELGLN